jgi:hypothetical protein
MLNRTPFERKARWVLALAFALRLALALINMDAFDPHMPVVASIAYDHFVPDKNDAWEGFQPKLWHATVAMVLRVVPTHHIRDITRIAQSINVIAGMGTLLLLMGFLRRLDVSEFTKTVAFGLVALNPMMIGIDAQATNDSFVIFFGTLALFHGYNFFQRPNWTSLGWMTLGATLAVMTKGNGLVIAVAIVCAFGVAILNRERRNRTWVAQCLLFVALVVVSMAALGPYGRHEVVYGDPFITNMGADPSPPQFFHYVPATKAEGVTTGVDWFFKIHPIDLMQDPHNHHTKRLFRTSLWTVIYAEWHFVHSDSWPFTWDDDRRWVKWLGRCILLLALLPTAIFISGLLRGVYGSARDLMKKQLSGAGLSRALMTGTAVGAFLFVAIYSYRCRDYECAKPIFFFPAMLALAYLFAGECERWVQGWGGKRFLAIVIVLLFIGYSIDATVIIYDQWHVVPGRWYGLCGWQC